MKKPYLTEETIKKAFIQEECRLRQPGETGAVYSAFCSYRDYGGDRSIRKVLKSTGMPDSRSGVRLAWSKRYAWVLRSEKYDAHLDKIIKINDHYMDAMRYGIFTANQQGIILS